MRAPRLSWELPASDVCSRLLPCSGPGDVRWPFSLLSVAWDNVMTWLMIGPRGSPKVRTDWMERCLRLQWVRLQGGLGGPLEVCFLIQLEAFFLPIWDVTVQFKQTHVLGIGSFLDRRFRRNCWIFICRRATTRERPWSFGERSPQLLRRKKKGPAVGNAPLSHWRSHVLVLAGTVWMFEAIGWVF